jgi:hypothetical protein
MSGEGKALAEDAVVAEWLKYGLQYLWTFPESNAVAGKLAALFWVKQW